MSYIRRNLWLAFLMIAFCMQLAWQNTDCWADETLRIVDCAGRSVQLPHEAQRIVDLTVGEGLRTLVALGAEEFLVGMSHEDHGIFQKTQLMAQAFTILPLVSPNLETLPNVGSVKEPSVEAILSLKPDVIFVMWSREDYADSLQKQIGIPVVCVGGYGSFNFELFTVVGRIVGREKRAEDLISYTKGKISQVSDISNEIPDDQRKRIFYWVRPMIGSPMTNGRYEAFTAAGAVNVAARGKNIPYGVFKVTKEQIVAWNPDMIFRQTSFTNPVPGWHTLETIQHDPLIQITKAAKNSDVFPTRGHMRGWDIATEAVEVLYLAKLIYPRLFPDLNVEQEGDEILKTYYGKLGLFSEMSRQTGLFQW